MIVTGRIWIKVVEQVVQQSWTSRRIRLATSKNRTRS